MPFQLSPGVLVTEKDLTAIVPAVATSVGGFVGTFQWGPVEQVVTVNNEVTLVEKFGKPNDTVFKSFFTAANFLAYGNNLQVIRAVNKGIAKNAVANVIAGNVLITNEEFYLNNYEDGSLGVGEFAAKYPGLLGNSLKVSMADGNTYSSWAYKDLFDSAPNTSDYVEERGGRHDEMHVIVIDEDGLWTGVRGSTLEKFAFVSKSSDAKKSDGSTAYYKNILNNQSKYVWWLDHPSAANTSNVVSATGSAWGSTSQGTTFANLTSNVTVSLSGGTNSETAADGNLTSAMEIFTNAEQYDLSLLMTGDAGTVVAEYAISNVAEARKDCIAFVSPDLTNVLQNAAAASSIKTRRDTLPSSSYAVMDSAWKYQYDRYNDKYRWVPCNGDLAGLCARTDLVADPWYSPGGFNRGQIKNVVKLAYSPNQTDRDTLYKNGINPVVSFPGQGTVLFGDKTMLAKPSAFDRINVRRLFIVLEKAIATAAKYQLFEFNDAFTRAQFRNLVEPFLRDVKGRRGITDFRVVCDETNNTGEVIDRNEFVADIYVKPARSINFIQLNFIATRTGVAFEEVVGA